MDGCVLVRGCVVLFVGGRRRRTWEGSGEGEGVWGGRGAFGGLGDHVDVSGPIQKMLNFSQVL